MRHHHHRITSAAAVTLALAAAAAPAAQADPQPLARAEAAIANPSIHPSAGSGPCSEVCSAPDYGSPNQRAWTPDKSGATLPHNPHPGSAATAGTSSRTVNAAIRTPVSCGDICSGHGYGPVRLPASIVRIVTPSGGFDWGDAGIGAAATVALMLIGTALLATTNHRGRRARQQQPRVGS